MSWETVWECDITTVTPVNDLVAHEEQDDNCVCGPTWERVIHDDGGDAWMLVHHALDGRE